MEGIPVLEVQLPIFNSWTSTRLRDTVMWLPICRYRASEGSQVPFKVIPVVKELGRTRLEANVSVRSLFGAKMFALNTVVLVPVPDYTAKCTILVTSGKAKYDATRKAIVS